MKGETREEYGRNEKQSKLDGKSKEHPEPGGDGKTGTKRGQGDGKRKMSGQERSERSTQEGGREAVKKPAYWHLAGAVKEATH